MNANQVLIAAFVFSAFSMCSGQEVPVDLPPGFSIRKVAGNDLVPDASAMTVDPDGAPIVSGPGYVRRLLDGDGDGVFESYETLAMTKGIAQGIWFDGKQMWLTVDGAVKRSVSKDDGKPFVFENVVEITTDAEHGSHAIRRSPDGLWWYVICGNATKIRSQFSSMNNSPIKEPRAGFVMRFPASVEAGDKFAAEIFCHGFRNAYDFDFDSTGRLFVYDSDGERDVSLPWYRPTRIFAMDEGGDAGWVSAGWKRPASYFDMPELIGSLGRGSPTGVAVCDAREFGSRYEGAVFVGDWTFGRIGVGRRGKEVEIFAKPQGSFGFAITDLEFSNDGSLFVTTGGRGTEGSLYRITGPANLKHQASSKPAKTVDMTYSFNPAAIGFGKTADRSRSFAVRLSKIPYEDDAKISKVIRLLQLMQGGCGGDRMFAGHQAKWPITFSDSDRTLVVDELSDLLRRKKEPMEVARLAGMLALKDDYLVNVLAEVCAAEKNPVTRIHYLNCIAVEGGTLKANSADAVADSLLRVRREIDAADLPVDRNWKPRMQQLADALFRDMRIAESIVRDESFGQASDIWIYDSLPEIFRSMARAKVASSLEANCEKVTRDQLRAISGDSKYSSLVRSFSGNKDLTDIVVLAVSKKPTIADQEVLMRGLSSFNLTVNKTALIGLRKINELVPSTDDFKKLAALERKLGWRNPEVSVRDQIVMSLRQWTGKNHGYLDRQYDLQPEMIRQQRSSFERWQRYLADAHKVPMVAEVSAEKLMQRMTKDVNFDIGNAISGKAAFTKFQCAACHNGGGQNSGPSLAGVASRFSRDDVLRAIVDPNDNVPDRYRATMVATEDGQLFQGSVVYESMAGIMLATSTGEVVRIDAKDVESKRKTNKSLMPEGLLDEATDQEVADLWAYLKSL